MKKRLRSLSVILYWLIMIGLLGLFFSNDFGLVDIHKTSVAVAIGVDLEDDEVVVTAQLAVPQPSSSGENIQYKAVQGQGRTLADALNEVNAKTGFYPKLLFCKLVILGESCREKNLFEVAGCLYRKYFSELTAQVATCEGKAYDLLSMKAALSDETSQAILNVLSSENKRTAHVSSVTLKDIAIENYGQSQSCYIPLIEPIKAGTSEEGMNGESVGGDKAEQGGGSEGGGNGESKDGGGGGLGGQGGQGGQSEGGGEEVEFAASRTAYYKNGEFIGVLDERLSFALEMLKNNIRIASLSCDTDEKHYTVGLRKLKCGAELKIDGGLPRLKFSCGGTALIQGIREKVDPAESISDDKLSPEVLKAVDEELKSRLEELVEICRESDCDLLGVRSMLFKKHYKKFDAFKDDILQKLQIEYDMNVKSLT